MKTDTKSKKVNKAWLNEHVHDTYVKLAQREGYRSRAAYKLKEIDEQLGLIKPGQIVVDLGAAPGAWSQYLRRRFAPRVAGQGGAAVGELQWGGLAGTHWFISPATGLAGVVMAQRHWGFWNKFWFRYKARVYEAAGQHPGGLNKSKS